MSYFANGKTYTDHPLMDEICHHCKRILKGIVIKNDVLAGNMETKDSVIYGEAYITLCEEGKIRFELFPFNYDIYYLYYNDAFKASNYSKDKYRVPIEEREGLTNFANEYFKANFVETNNYYRSLMGLPPYDGINEDGSNEYDIFIFREELPEGYNGYFDPALPLHEQSDELIDVLYADGIIDKLREKDFPGSNYTYMEHMASKSIDLYTARKAAKWDILYMPNVYYLIEDRFTELYKINRELYMYRSYQKFYAQTGEYYDQLMILMVLAQTFSDLVTDVPEWYIRRDIFDIRSCQYFLESYGVKFFKTIPLKFQIRIVKGINNLIKYKSSNQNFDDILSIFDVDADIFKYWLYKSYDEKTGEYNLEFISSKVDESYDSYIKNKIYRTPYDDITLQDKYWDGEDSHDYVKKQIHDQEFTIRGTKYMSIEYHISLSEFLYQMEYMLGTILDSRIDMSDILVPIPTIDENIKFKMSNLFLFLVILSKSFYRATLDDKSTEVIYPEDMSEGTIPTIDEAHYDWKKKYLKEMYIKKNGRIHGFNTSLDKESLRSKLRRRHSHFTFGDEPENFRIMKDSEYEALADKVIAKSGINEFIVGGNFDSVEELMHYYNTNTECYKKLTDQMLRVNNQDDKFTLDYVFQELFTREYDTNYYILSNGEKADDLLDVLKDRDFILYETVYKIMSENSLDYRQDVIRNIMNDVIETLEYYFYGQGVDYLFAFTSTQSFEAIIQYIYLMIGFFKSYKVYFLDPYTTYVTDDKLENSAKAIDNIAEVRYDMWKWDKLQAYDIINGIRIEELIKDSGLNDTIVREVVDIYKHREDDPLSDEDYDGLNAELGEKKDSFLIDGGNAKDGGLTENGVFIYHQYINVNGGAAQKGMLNWKNIDGSSAYENPSADYYTINGGYAYDPYSERSDAMGSQMFTYVIDGGAAGGRLFSNATTKLYLIGTELFGEVMVSERNKHLTIAEDGLLFKDDFVSWTLFNNAVNGLSISLWEIINEGNSIHEAVVILSDEQKLKDRITMIRDNILEPMYYVAEQMKDDLFIKRNKEAVDRLVSTAETNTNPYTWLDLD